jgi:primosomal protein N'
MVPSRQLTETITCPSCGETISCPGCERLADVTRHAETQMLSADRNRNEVLRQEATIKRLQERVRMCEGAPP